MKLADALDMSPSPMGLLKHGLHGPRNPDTVCRAIRYAYGLLIVMAAGTGAWSLFSQI